MTRGRKPYERLNCWTWALQSKLDAQRILIGYEMSTRSDVQCERERMPDPWNWRIVKVDIFDCDLRAEPTLDDHGGPA